MKKRGLNIEIASELVDLIMDVADEAFSFNETSRLGDEVPATLLPKAKWREWMGIFTQGKKVSEQGIVVTQEE